MSDAQKQLPAELTATLSTTTGAAEEGSAEWAQTVSEEQHHRIRSTLSSHDKRQGRTCVAIWLGILAYDLHFCEGAPSEEDVKTLRRAARLGGGATENWKQTAPKHLHRAMVERLPTFSNDSTRARALITFGLAAFEEAMEQGCAIASRAFKELGEGENGGGS